MQSPHSNHGQTNWLRDGKGNKGAQLQGWTHGKRGGGGSVGDGEHEKKVADQKGTDDHEEGTKRNKAVNGGNGERIVKPRLSG